MTDILYEDWEPVIGLEIHVQLNTRSKLFSPAPNHFGDEPNTNITDVCTGQPGALPVLNKEAVKKPSIWLRRPCDDRPFQQIRPQILLLSRQPAQFSNHPI